MRIGFVSPRIGRPAASREAKHVCRREQRSASFTNEAGAVPKVVDHEQRREGVRFRKRGIGSGRRFGIHKGTLSWRLRSPPHETTYTLAPRLTRYTAAWLIAGF